MLYVNEIFGPTVQGEGKSIGKTVSFLRLSACNLACIWCDTPYTWNWKGTKFAHPDKFDRKKEVKKMTIEEVFEVLTSLGSKAVVISGGEPLLQQKELISLCKMLNSRDFWIEIETNGTILPEPELYDLVNQINCSPKLSNSGIDNTFEKRIKPDVLKRLGNFYAATFKFVVSQESDLLEIEDLISKYRLKNVYLMPEGRTKQEQEKNQVLVQNFASERGLNFSPRLHILLYDAKRGV